MTVPVSTGDIPVSISRRLCSCSSSSCNNAAPFVSKRSAAGCWTIPSCASLLDCMRYPIARHVRGALKLSTMCGKISSPFSENLSTDKSLCKAQGPVWHQSDRQAGRIPEHLRHLDTDGAWSTSGYHGWVYG